MICKVLPVCAAGLTCVYNPRLADAPGKCQFSTSATAAAELTSATTVDATTTNSASVISISKSVSASATVATTSMSRSERSLIGSVLIASLSALML
ncbi:UNVERIFIED_CONTAM: hypothetical protein HDU68_011534 [Siphonaria sp. JEL0065]|nr:hypothetical protein HDU68_011534 [Siphonaria sp. JEL0065]